MSALLLTVTLTLAGLFCIGGMAACAWIEKNTVQPVVRGYVE